MIKLNLIFCLFFMISSYGTAQSLATEDVLEELPVVKKQADLPEKPKVQVKVQKNHSPAQSPRVVDANPIHRINGTTGNLPLYARRTQAVYEFETPTIIPKNTDFDKHIEIKSGDILKAVINHNIVAYPSSKSPVTARVLEGQFKGSTLLGEASLDPSTKRINITFKSIRPLKSKYPYNLTGILLDDDGLMGIEGKYESNYWTYFWAETLTNTISGLADATTRKNQNVWGANVTEPGIDPALRQGVALGFSKTAERLGEKVKNPLEIATAYSPIIVHITITQ